MQDAIKVTTENGGVFVDFAKDDDWYVNEIDHILSEKGREKNIKNVRNYIYPNVE